MIVRAFVSSTFQDLKDHRTYVISALRRAGIFVDPMEDWTATSDEPRRLSQHRVQGSDLCILLVAFRRGHIPQGETRSITQLEYEAAVREGVDVLVFLLDEEAPWPRRFDELKDDPLLREWRKELVETRTVDFFGLEPASVDIWPAIARWLAARVRKYMAVPKAESHELRRIWYVPHLRNPNFTGRDELLDRLRTDLKNGQASAVTQAIAGLGGVGKTQLALEYAYRHADDYPVVWWVRAEEPATLLEDMAQLARALGLPEAAAPDLSAAAAAACRWLEGSRDWLLVFDNATEPSAIREARPRSSSGHVLITSRNTVWSNVAKKLEVPTLDRDASIELLLKLSGDTDRAAADELAQELGDLPLALEQTGAFVEASGDTIAAYMRLYREQGRALRARRAESSEYPHSVATTYEISIGKLAGEAPEAAELLDLLAFAAPEAFPLSVLRDAGDALPPTLRRLSGDAMALADARAAIRKLSLAQVEGDGLSMHRVVQAVVRDRLGAERSAELAAALIAVLSAVFPFDQNDPGTWPASGQLLPHVLSAADHAEASEAVSESLGRVLNDVGLYYGVRAEFVLAKAALERALRIDEAAYGAEHPNVAIRVNNLGNALQDLGDLAGAGAAYERALRIDEAAYGAEHPNVARDLNNLGGVLWALGDLAGARAAGERALRIIEQFLGPEHPNTRLVRHNLESLASEEDQT